MTRVIIMCMQHNMSGNSLVCLYSLSLSVCSVGIGVRHGEASVHRSIENARSLGGQLCVFHCQGCWLPDAAVDLVSEWRADITRLLSVLWDLFKPGGRQPTLPAHSWSVQRRRWSNHRQGGECRGQRQLLGWAHCHRCALYLYLLRTEYVSNRLVFIVLSQFKDGLFMQCLRWTPHGDVCPGRGFNLFGVETVHIMKLNTYLLNRLSLSCYLTSHIWLYSPLILHCEREYWIQ